MKRSIVALLLSVCCWAIVAAEVRCHIDAYISTPDNRDIELYAEPEPGAKAIRKLEADDMVVVDRMDNGFYHLRATLRVRDPRAISEGIFDNIDGWVKADTVGLGIRGGRVYAKGATGKVIDRVDVDLPAQMVSCRGRWAEVVYRNNLEGGGKGTEKQGWLPPFAQCGNSLTTCP